MGTFTPDPGTLYRNLFDQCRQTFKLSDTPVQQEFVCFGSPSGNDCVCVFRNEKTLITITTPQRLSDREHWISWTTSLRGVSKGSRWTRTTGFLHVVQVVPASSPSFGWFDPAAIVHDFDIRASSSDINDARKKFIALTAADEGTSPGLCRHGSFHLFATSETDLGDLRSASLLQNENHHITLYRLQDILALNFFRDQECFPHGDSSQLLKNMSEAERAEIFVYEFELAGEHSCNFSVAS